MTIVSPVSILSAVLDKIENFNFRWSEVVGSCQDGLGVTDSRWSFVVHVKICVGVCIRSSIAGYAQIKTILQILVHNRGGRKLRAECFHLSVEP